MEKNKINHKIEILSPPETVDMADDWYQYATLDHFWMQSRFRAISSLLAQETIGKSYLEIGCGHGAVIQQFEKRYDVAVDGCDLNMHALHQIGETRGKIYCLNIFDKPKELLDKYDGVILLDVIEHIDDDISFLENSLAYVKKGGLVIINVPALNALFSKYDTAAGHKRRYNKRMMRALFDKCNISEVSIAYWGLSLVPIAIIRISMLNFVKKENIIATGFKMPNQTVNYCLNWMLQAENRLLRSPSIGTSLIGIGRINNH